MPSAATGEALVIDPKIPGVIREARLRKLGMHASDTALLAFQDVRVPESVQAVIAARIDRLPVEEKRALQIASVIGERFGAGQVAALIGAAAPLAVLRRKGLVVEEDGADARCRVRRPAKAGTRRLP